MSTMNRRRSLGLWLVVAVGLAVVAPLGAGAQDAAAPTAEESAAAEAEADRKQEEAAVEEVKQVELDPAVFDVALEDFYAGKFAEAAAGFWGFIHYGDPASENFEWAQFFLGESLQGLGFWHASVQYYYQVAKTRQRPEILPVALERLEEISRTRPFSEELVYEDLLYDSEFGFLPRELENWVHYVQGLFNYQNDLLRWGDRHFEQIKQKSAYHLRAQYVRGVQALRKKRDDEALALFELITESKIDAPDVKNRAHLAMARLLFDNGEYALALKEYDKVVQIDLSFEQATLLLEKAWAHYYLNDYRKAMGLLHALKAPSYAKFMLPDAYVLRGLIYKQLCHFIPAKRVVREFRFTYGRPLELLRRRTSVEQIPSLLEGATQEGAIARRTAFLKSLQDERKRIDDYDSVWEDVELDKHLRRVYDLEIREQMRMWKVDFEPSADAIALHLLETEEQVNLLDYEVGLDIFKRLKREEARKVAEEALLIPYDSANVYYEFDTEYWNDELHSYEFFINSRCFEGEQE